MVCWGASSLRFTVRNLVLSGGVWRKSDQFAVDVDLIIIICSSLVVSFWSFSKNMTNSIISRCTAVGLLSLWFLKNFSQVLGHFSMVNDLDCSTLVYVQLSCSTFRSAMLFYTSSSSLFKSLRESQCVLNRVFRKRLKAKDINGHPPKPSGQSYYWSPNS